MYRFLVTLLLFCTILMGCGGGSGLDGQPRTSLPTRSVILGQEFTLRVGQDARLEAEGLTVTLRMVPDDYRCPEDVVCGWEGNARVQVELKAAPHLGTVVNFHTSPRMGSQGGPTSLMRSNWYLSHPISEQAGPLSQTNI
jgi:hypothetical protein